MFVRGGALLLMFLQYSLLNYKVFNRFPSEVKYTLGRICEMIPFALLGCIFYKKKLFTKMEQKRVFFMICAIVLFILTFLFRNTLKNPLGFGYSGIITIIKAICLVVFFYLLPQSELSFYRS